MKVYSGAVALLLASSCNNNIASSFQIPRIHHQKIQTNRQTAFLSSTTSGRTSDEIAKELSAGVLLNNNDQGASTDMSSSHSVQVLDFGNVLNESSKAEIALREAKEKLNGISLTTHTQLKQGERLMGINDEVTAEVGYEVGNDVDPVLIQQCASYLRSKVPSSAFSPQENDEVAFDPSNIEAYQKLLTHSYQESGVITEAFAKTFYLGTQLLPPAAQRAIWAIYVWCRRTDEIVDAPRSYSTPEQNNAEMLRDLSIWERRLERLWSHGEVVDLLDLALLDTRMKYPNLSIQPFVDMIRGMLMDIPGLGQERYSTFDELHLYCYRVAGTVGLMSMPIFGCDKGYTEEDAKEPALSLGVAFQITNILRDVGEDASNRGRIYLPTEDMKKFGVTESQIFQKRLDSNYINMMKYEIARARQYYLKAASGVPMLSEAGKLPVQISLDCYAKILDKIEENGYDNFNKRAYVSKWEKIFEIPFSWYRTLEISKVLPLPGDDERNQIPNLEELEKLAVTGEVKMEGKEKQ